MLPAVLREALQCNVATLEWVISEGGQGFAYFPSTGIDDFWLSPPAHQTIERAFVDRDGALRIVVEPDDVRRLFDEAASDKLATSTLRWTREDGASVSTRGDAILLSGENGEAEGLLVATGLIANGEDGFDVIEVLDFLPGLVWTLWPNGEADYISPQWVAYTGVPAHEQDGYRWMEQVHPDDRRLIRKRWAVASSNEKMFEADYRLRRHDGVYRWFTTRATPLHDSEGGVSKWLGNTNDAQDWHDIKDRLAAANEQLEERVRERTLALERANQRLATAERVAMMGSWSLEIATGEVEWSSGLFHVAGLDETSGAPAYATQASLYLPESWERLTEAVEHARVTGEGYELEIGLVRPDGEVRATVARAQAGRDADGEVDRLVGTLHDITEMAEARRKHDIARERLLLATSASRMSIWDWQPEDDLLIWDNSMHELYGLEPGTSASYELWRSRVHPEDREEAGQVLEAALAGTAPYDTSFRVQHPDKSVRHVRAVGTVERDPSGAPVRMVGMNWDVTAERTAQAELRAHERVLQTFLRHAPAAIAMFDRKMRYMSTSEQWLSAFQIEDRGTIFGRSFYEDFPAMPPHWREAHERVLAGATEAYDADPYPGADGRTRWLQWEARPWHRADGEIGGLIVFSQVITPAREMAMRLERQKEELERSNHDLEQFAYAASHDLQEPLRAVSGCAQILRNSYGEQLDEQADVLIDHIVDGASRMAALITALLSYSRVTSHGAHFSKTPAHDALEIALANLNTSIVESGAEITVGELPEVEVDSSQLALVFQNLVGNALKYRSDEPPRIQITAMPSGAAGEWVFSIRDNGIGIEAAYFERIFVLFQRLHTRSEHPGTGIGLALCQKIVQRHGGRIWLESEFGTGTTFYFSLPTHHRIT